MTGPSMYLIPSELAIGEVYFPPLLIAAMLGFVLAWLTAHMLNRYHGIRSASFYTPFLLRFRNYSDLHMNGVQISGSLQVITRLRRPPRKRSASSKNTSARRFPRCVM
jgi:hypothetical protein